jgi:hypothetical protein
VSERFGLGLLLSCLAILLIGGCASTPADPDNSRSVSIGASFKQLGIGSNISRVLLEISGSGFTTIAQDLEITNGLVKADVEVPFGTGRVFALTAYAGQTALYYGADTADVSASAITEVFVYMQPQVTMIKITPMYDSISSIGIEGTLRVEVYNVDSLFGLSLRLEVDSSIIEFLHDEYMSAEAGNFLGTAENTLFFVQTYPHYLSIGYTMRGNNGQPMGVTGSGLIATVRYVAKKVGKTPVTIDPVYLRLIGWQGHELPEIYIENGEVEVLGY